MKNQPFHLPASLQMTLQMHHLRSDFFSWVKIPNGWHHEIAVINAKTLNNVRHWPEILLIFFFMNKIYLNMNAKQPIVIAQQTNKQTNINGSGSSLEKNDNDRQRQWWRWY